jgi:hypothetical protein
MLKIVPVAPLRSVARVRPRMPEIHKLTQRR